ASRRGIYMDARVGMHVRVAFYLLLSLPLLPRAPRSTLFPYTTLFRSLDATKVHPINHSGEFFTVPGAALTHPGPQHTPFLFQARSEEHTSELQSRFELVCRLLPEKKKKTDKRTAATIKHINSVAVCTS